MPDRTVGERLVDALLWRAAGPYSDPPASIAELPVDEQRALYEQADRVARRRGEDFAMGLAEDLAQHHHDNAGRQRS